MLILTRLLSVASGDLRINNHQPQVCKSVKYLMLHIRDCCGTLPDGSECPFPWCRPCKYLIHHLVKCHKPDECIICSPQDLPPSLARLRTLNQQREEQAQEPSNGSQSNQQPPQPSGTPVKAVG